MEAGIYPSKATRMEWSLRHMDYFYGNYHKFNLDPSFKDDDVESETNGIAKEMKSDYMVDGVLKNVRGLSNTPNPDQIIQFLNEDSYSLCGLLETRVKKKKLSGIYRRVFGNWDWVFNAHSCDGGTRIIVGWDPRSVNVMVIKQSSEVMHCFMELINGCDSFHCSFVYANVKSMERRSLWRSLMKYKCSVGGTSWVVLGDFNVSINPSKKSSGCSKITTDMCDFKECLANIKAEDIAMTGLHFTWNKNPGKISGLLKKLDRILGNVQFMAFFPNSYANFLSFMKSDHSSVMLVIPEVEVEGYSMFSVVSKLKSLKRPLRILNANQGNPFDNVKKLRAKLGNIQSDMVADPYNNSLREAELKCLKAYNSALKDE
ncbi:RNA-directed DNA polymerase, eukaryota, reverse transcriptase zinc-binding domain protein [Tanacetum coccineum]